jgi:imidazolonepropionase
MGGGIHSTVRATRDATEQQLLDDFVERAHSMLARGTTTMEAKSGYGLDTDTELKMLRVLAAARQHGCPEISSTYCGAHAVPKDITAEQATEDVCNVQASQ